MLIKYEDKLYEFKVTEEYCRGCAFHAENDCKIISYNELACWDRDDNEGIFVEVTDE